MKLKYVIGIYIIICLLGRLTYARKQVTIEVWGLWDTEGYKRCVYEFEKRFPYIKVKVLPIGGKMDPQKLMTAIAGGTPPDVIKQDRFSVGEWASRDAFMILDDFIKRDNYPIQDYYEACLKEATYRGHIYAIPRITDARALYYNRKLFREAGLNPDRPPRTWDELYRYAKKLTRIDKNGNFERIGFIPNYGNSWLYLYGWQNGGKFMSDDGRKCTLNHPKIVEALEWLVKFYDSFEGIEKINAFQSTFQGGQFDPFITGKVAMKIDGNWYLNDIARFAPELDFGVAPAPVPEGRPFITWSGGFSFAIPVGAKHPEEAWTFIKWMNSLEGWIIYNQAERDYNKARGTPFVPLLTANKKIDKIIFKMFAPKEKKLRKALKVFLDLMPYSKFRPVTPVGQRLWDEHVRAFELAVYHKLTPKQALDIGTKKVQEELDKILKKETERKHPVKLKFIIYTLVLLIIIILLFFFIKTRNFIKTNPLQKSEMKWGLIFASPWIIGFLIFTAGPIIASIILSFCQYDVLHVPNFIGLRNYVNLFVNDPLFYKSLWNTFIITIFNVPLSIIIGLLLAMLLNTSIKGLSVYRTIFYLPSIVPVVAASILWIWMFHPEFGLINSILKWINELIKGIGLQFPLPHWLGSEKWSKPAIIFMKLWGAGGSIILWLAGLQGIPESLYEAAEIDGANSWQKFWYVTIPMISPYIFFNMVMGIIGSLQIFTESYIMTGGGPVDSTLFYVYYLFNNAFRYFKMGYASAMAWILFIIIMVLTLIQLKLSKKWVHYG